MPPKGKGTNPQAKKKVVAKKPAQPGDKGKSEPVKSNIFEKRTRNFSIGRDLPPRRDVTRFVKWPRYILLQRQKRVLQKRLKVPPAINQFTRTVDKSTAASLFKLLENHKPETKQAKKARLLEVAKAKAAGEKAQVGTKPNVIKFGIKHITALIESKKASLVVIAHDVEPLEIVIWLPSLCRKMGVPYCIVKGKSRLGQVVGKKTATALAFTNINKDDRAQFTKIVEAVNLIPAYDDIRRRWGGGVMGVKSIARKVKRERALAQETMPGTKV